MNKAILMVLIVVAPCLVAMDQESKDQVTLSDYYYNQLADEAINIKSDATEIDSPRAKLIIKNGTFGDLKKGLHLAELYNQSLKMESDGRYIADLERINAVLEETSATKSETRQLLRKWRKILVADYRRVTVDSLPSGLKEKVLYEALLKMIDSADDLEEKGVVYNPKELCELFKSESNPNNNNNNSVIKRSFSSDILSSSDGFDPKSLLFGGAVVGCVWGISALVKKQK